MCSILVIESHLELRGFITALLLGAGHRVLGAESVPDAATLLAGARVDVIVTDFALAGRAGGEAIARLRRTQPAVEVVPLSAAAESAGYLRLAAVLGAVRTFTQPFMSAALVELTRPIGRSNVDCLTTRNAPFRRRLLFPQRGES